MGVLEWSDRSDHSFLCGAGRNREGYYSIVVRFLNFIRVWITEQREEFAGRGIAVTSMPSSSHPPHRLPLHAHNFLSLVSSRRLSIDPKATYRGCTFRYSPSDVQDGSARYRWGHACEGYGRSGLADRERGDCLEGLLRECKHKVFGGVYYGMSYGEVMRRIEQGEGGGGEEKEAVLLTVPYGGMTSKFSVVRVSESPREWGERLLLNSVVLGYLDCGDGTSLDVLRTMARQRAGPPKIVDCGIIQ
ncbi:hypothetical protein ACHAWX_004901 [Stephanocyclus meneghinianus]